MRIWGFRAGHPLDRERDDADPIGPGIQARDRNAVERRKPVDEPGGELLLGGGRRPSRSIGDMDRARVRPWCRRSAACIRLVSTLYHELGIAVDDALGRNFVPDME